MNKGLMRLYFDGVYNRAYDLTVARLSPYRRLQAHCLDKLELNGDKSILCVGVGTGNEVLGVLARNGTGNLSLTGVDTSMSGLGRAYRKAQGRGKEIATLRMDAHRLGFRDGSFDVVLCLHLMGFLEDDARATGEVFRVLKGNGQFVITYPSGRGGPGLAGEIWHGVREKLRAGKYTQAMGECLAGLGAGVLYMPASLWVRPKQGFYSLPDLKALLSSFTPGGYSIEEDPVYQDFIVYGRK